MSDWQDELDAELALGDQAVAPTCALEDCEGCAFDGFCEVQEARHDQG